MIVAVRRLAMDGYVCAHVVAAVEGRQRQSKTRAQQSFKGFFAHDDDEDENDRSSSAEGGKMREKRRNGAKTTRQPYTRTRYATIYPISYLGLEMLI